MLFALSELMIFDLGICQPQQQVQSAIDIGFEHEESIWLQGRVFLWIDRHLYAWEFLHNLHGMRGGCEIADDD